MSYGFIITRHVNSEKTNQYWNQSIKLIKHFYPNNQIVIIDDNSDEKYLKSYNNYENIIIIKSEWKGRGELLPYIYYLQYKWFDKAIILHDSVFIHKKYPFELINIPVLPLWHHKYDQENLRNSFIQASFLQNNQNIIKNLKNDESTLLFSKRQNILCFGAQSFISLSFLQHIENKYKLTNLLKIVKSREDRSTFERILGIIFCEEIPKLLQIKSLFGSIYSHPYAFNYTYDNYLYDLIHKKKVVRSVVKVWTGR